MSCLDLAPFDRRAFLGSLVLSVLAVPLAAAQQAGRGYLIGVLSPALRLTPETRFSLEPCGKACASLAMWKVRTSALSPDGRRGSMIGSPTWRPSWCV